MVTSHLNCPYCRFYGCFKSFTWFWFWYYFQVVSWNIRTEKSLPSLLLLAREHAKLGLVTNWVKFISIIRWWANLTILLFTWTFVTWYFCFPCKAKLTNPFWQTRLVTPSTDKHYSIPLEAFYSQKNNNSCTPCMPMFVIVLTVTILQCSALDVFFPMFYSQTKLYSCSVYEITVSKCYTLEINLREMSVNNTHLTKVLGLSWRFWQLKIWTGCLYLILSLKRNCIRESQTPGLKWHWRVYTPCLYTVPMLKKCSLFYFLSYHFNCLLLQPFSSSRWKENKTPG